MLNLESRPSWLTCYTSNIISWMRFDDPMTSKNLSMTSRLKYVSNRTEYKYFMFRDFQSRNILVKARITSIHFIDYQGGMKGAPQYDVASMLWQARANLPDEWKENLLVDYMNAFESLIGSSLERNIFRQPVQWLCVDSIAAGAWGLWFPRVV
jgi:aminoglycoside/choline kinase family phosphotransferase